MSKADAQKLWGSGDGSLLVNKVKLRGLAFTPTGEWIEVELPKLTGVPAHNVPEGVTALRKLVPPPSSIEGIEKQAPEIIAKLKDAAQKHSEADLKLLVDSTLLANKG